MYKIVKIHKYDSYYPNRKQLIGLTGTFKEKSPTERGFRSGMFTYTEPAPSLLNGRKSSYFYGVKLEEVK